MREFLLAVTVMVIASWRLGRGQDPAAGALVALEGHGRRDDILGTDTTNTVGWFNTVFPVRLGSGASAIDVQRAERDPETARALLDSVTAGLSGVPHGGLDYGLLRHIRGAAGLSREPQLMFSYLGRLDLSGADDRPWGLVAGRYPDAVPVDPEPDLPLRFALHIGSLVAAGGSGPQLVTTMRWSAALFDPADIDRLTELWQRGVAALAAGLAPDSTGMDQPGHG